MPTINKQSYDDGFRAKCAEYGIDPDELLGHIEKSAQDARTGDIGWWGMEGPPSDRSRNARTRFIRRRQAPPAEIPRGYNDFSGMPESLRPQIPWNTAPYGPEQAPAPVPAPYTPAAPSRNRDMLRWLDQSGGFMNDLGGNIWNQGRNIGRGIENIGIGISDWWGGGGGPKHEYISWGQDPERMKPRTYIGKPVRAETWDKWTPEQKLRAAQTGAQLPSQQELNKIRAAKADKAKEEDLPWEVRINRQLNSLSAPWEYV